MSSSSKDAVILATAKTWLSKREKRPTISDAFFVSVKNLARKAVESVWSICTLAISWYISLLKLSTSGSMYFW